DYHDAWFIGFSPHITVGVWVGREVGLEPIGYRETGAVAALPIWIKFMEKSLTKYPDDDFEVPSGISFLKICKREGCIPRGYCDDLTDEAFITGSEKVPPCN
ncbi:penicillin-binding protein, partial [bacterium]|nr:penicillin-binding protein [bacterium]